MIPGRATAEATKAYHEHHGTLQAARNPGGLWFPSLGIGTYLGPAGEPTSVGYQASIWKALDGGMNLIDSASNYRDGTSECDVGAALESYVASGGSREEVILTSKAGFLFADVVDPERTVEGLPLKGTSSCFEPEFIKAQLEASLLRLGVECIDLFFVHNPEPLFGPAVPAREGLAQLRAVFHVLEEARLEGKIQFYGLATWDGLALPEGSAGHVPLVKVVHEAGEAARQAGHDKASAHGFRAIELPINLARTEPYLLPNQPWKFGTHTTLQAAQDLDLITIASAPLGQTKLFGRIPEEWRIALETEDDPSTCLEFARSVPGVTTAIPGISTPEHASVPIALMQRKPKRQEVQTLLGPGGPHG